jgi:hypothetical protein
MTERTVQQLYPVGAMAGRSISLIVATVAPIFVLLLSFFNREEINAPWFCLAGLTLVGAASVTIVISSSPLRAPFTARRAALAYILANGAMVLDSLATLHTNSYIRDDFGPIVIGLIILAAAPYRPAKELAITGVLSSILVGVVALIESPWLITPASPFLFALAAMAPLLIMSLGAATFTTVIVQGLERWRRQARIAVEALGDEGADWIARSVQQDRVTILNRDVVPFFTQLLHDAAVSAEDVERARTISDSIRSVMVAEVDRSWLDIVVDHAATTHRIEPIAHEAIVDNQRLAQQMSTDQRAAVRAFVVALFGHPSFTTDEFSVVVSDATARNEVVISARLDCPENQVRSELSPYFAIMRVLFADLTVDLAQPELTLIFSYDK